MTTPAGILTELATLVLLLRDHPEQREEGRTVFKRFAAALPDSDNVLRLSPLGFTWNDVELAAGRGALGTLHDQLLGHGIGEIRLPVGLMTSTLLSLIRTVAAPVGTYSSLDHLVARLDAAGCGAVQVLPLREAEGSAPTSLPITPLEPIAPARPKSLRPEEDDGHLSALGPDALTEAKVGMMHFVSLHQHEMGPTSDLVNQLASAEGSADSNEKLNQLLAAGELATRTAEWKELLGAAFGLVELEKAGKSGENRGYGIALRRLLPRSSLERIGWLTAHGNLKTEATAVMRRMGADGTEVLLNLLVNSEDMLERRAYFSALKEMSEGGPLLVHMLSHDQWFVVRNVAELCGELREEKSVHALARLMGHSDERVRRAVAGALGKIGGSPAVEPLRRAFSDPSASVRLQAAQDLDGRKNRTLAMTLSLAAEAEGKADVQREMYLALGRIGSNDALHALAKAAGPGGKFFKRKPSSARLSAINGLHAAGPSGAGPLKELMTDEDAEIREAVQRALSTLWE